MALSEKHPRNWRLCGHRGDSWDFVIIDEVAAKSAAKGGFAIGDNRSKSAAGREG